MIRAFRLASICLALPAANAAHAQSRAAGRCELMAPVIAPATVTASYDPFDAQPTEQQFSVDIRGEDCPANRALFLRLTSDEVNRVSGRQITLQSGGGGTLVATIGDRASNDSIPRGVGGDHVLVRSGLNTLYLIVPRGQVVAPGVYRAELMAESRTDLGQPHAGPAAPLQLVVTVMPSVGLAAATGGRTIDFGELADGATAEAVTFDAYANVDYELALVSDNGFRMVLDRAGGGQGVPYVARLDGREASTGAAIGFVVPTSRARRRHALDALVPSIAGAPAGQYRDAVTVTISPRVAG